MATLYYTGQKCSDPIRFRYQRVLLRASLVPSPTPPGLGTRLVTGIFSELNQHCSSIRTVSDQYAHICIRPVCLRAVFVKLIQSCRTDTDPIYCSMSDPLPKSSVAFLGTNLDQIGSSSDSGFCCVHRIGCFERGGARLAASL